MHLFVICKSENYSAQPSRAGGDGSVAVAGTKHGKTLGTDSRSKFADNHLFLPSAVDSADTRCFQSLTNAQSKGRGSG